MNEIPLVSVIVPCYNSGNTLSRTIDSVARQTWEKIELIIVNDGSTDKSTIELLDFFSTKPNIIVHSQINKGLASARNNGIRISKGDFILPLDSDDWLDDNAIEIMIDTFRLGSESSIVFSDIKLEGKRVGVKKTYCNPFEQLFSNQLPYCMLFPKCIIQEINGYDENLVYGLEDWDLNLRLLTSGYKFKKIDTPLFHYTTAQSGMFWDKTSRDFGFIFKKIRNKNFVNYKFGNLSKTYKISKEIPSKRVIFLYFILNSIYKITPTIIINSMYSTMYKLRNKSFLASYHLNSEINKSKDRF